MEVDEVWVLPFSVSIFFTGVEVDNCFVSGIESKEGSFKVGRERGGGRIEISAELVGKDC